jgi:hypothetical protein
MAKPVVDIASLGITQEMLDELEKSIEIAYSNVRDPEVMRQAAERMDRLRKEIYQREGSLDLAVPLLRESRDET